MGIYHSNLLEAQNKIAFPLNVYLGYDLAVEDFFENFYLPPEYRAANGIGHPIPQNIASEMIGQVGTRTIITGPLGSGKSTFLLSEYLRLMQKVRFGNLKTEPPFLYFEQLFSEGGKGIYGTIRHQPSVVFIDSLDEASAGGDRERLVEQVRSLLDLPGLVLACRSPFFHEVLAEVRENFHVIIELRELGEFGQKQLIRRYFDSPQLSVGEDAQKSLNRALAVAKRCNVQSENPLMRTPLFSALCVLAGLDRRPTHRLSGIAEVYEHFFSTVVSRKLESLKRAEDKIAQLAFDIEEAALKGTDVSVDRVVQLFGVRNVSAVSDILVIRERKFDHKMLVIGFRHRSFAEFLVAWFVARKILSRRVGSNALVKALSILLNYETSYFVRRILRQLSTKSLSFVSDRLINVATLYCMNVNDELVIASHNALYFSIWSSTKPENAIQDFIERISGELTKVHPLVLGTLAAGAMSAQVELPDINPIRMHEQSPMLRWRTLNYHLIYYGDMECSSVVSLTAPVSEGVSWERTREVLLERLTSRDEKRIRYRAWDLYNFKCFLKYTKYGLNPVERSKLSLGLTIAAAHSENDKELAKQIEGLKNYLAPMDNRVISEGGVATQTNLQRMHSATDVGIITIRDDEFGAVLQRLEVPETLHGKNRVYRRSEVNCENGMSYSIVVGRIPEQGPGAAQNFARDLIEDVNPRWIILVGIGGCSPSEDATLGDVVLGMRLHDFSVSAASEGGGREYSNQGGPMHRDVESIISNLSNKDPVFAHWSSPNSIGIPTPRIKWDDDLFYGAAEWRNKVKANLASGFSEDGIKVRPDRFITAGIASSGALVKDTLLMAEWMRTSRDVRSVEMELSGVYEAARRREGTIPVLAVRGLSDVVGYKRAQEWTEYAAHTAAAFTIQFLKSGAIPCGDAGS